MSNSKQIVVLTGLSGAGKTTAARALEDLGFFVVDNLPPQLIEPLIAFADSAAGEGRKRLAFVIDAREIAFVRDFPTTWERLQASGHQLLLLFLDCADDVLVRRFQETRRRHPLDNMGAGATVRPPTEGMQSLLQEKSGSFPAAGLLFAITAERALLGEMRARADHVIDTGALSVHELKRRVVERFGEERVGLSITLTSFGFKHGLPADLDMCFDARFLPNPYFVDALRKQTGLDDDVAAYVLGQPDALPFLDKVCDLVAFLIPRFVAEGKSYATVAIGCTGGKHRSVALVEAAVARLRALGFDVKVRHRDVERE
ncbi:MAG: RNase adapter RapZ [Deltaproteobacteria bacterium]|nr:RNase adapter RapZ [Deltaproteobacteria bacterium]